DSEVLSDDDIYIGRARGNRPPLGTLESGEAPVVQLRDVAAVALERALDEEPQIPRIEMQAIERLADLSGFSRAISEAGTLADVDHFESETGIAVLGTGVVKAVVPSRGRAEILTSGGGRDAGVVRIEPQGQACSVVLRFGDGRGTVLAALAG